VSSLSNPPHVPAASLARSAAFRSGFLAALGTWAVVVLPALVGWLAAPEGTLGWYSAVQVASAIWFLGHGQSLGGEGIAVSLTPLGLFLVFVYVTIRWARRLLQTQRATVGRLEWSRVVASGVVPGFLGGHLLAAALFAVTTLGGTVAPGLAAVPGTLLVPLAALGYLVLRPADPQAPGLVRAWFRRGGPWLPVAWHVGWRGARLLLLIGLGVAMLRLLVSVGDVLRIHGQYDLNIGASAVLVLAEVMVLGNAATWALAFVAGPGFSVAAGSLIAPAAAQPGLMPLVPILAALPEAADYPTAMFAVLLIPIGCGVVIARWVDQELEFFGNARAQLLATATSAAIAVIAVALLAWLGNGALGVDRLASIGPAVLPFTGALLLEVLLGAAAWAGWLLWRERAAQIGDSTDAVAEEAGSDESRSDGSGPDGSGPDGSGSDGSGSNDGRSGSGDTVAVTAADADPDSTSP